MATNPKPLRDIQKKFFRNRQKLRISKESMTMLNNAPENFILVKRQVIKAKFFTWAIWFEASSRNRRRQIKSTKVATDIRVSTVFMGLDRHNLFETMIFGGHHNGYQDRYYTYDQALAGHQRACELAFEVPQ